VVVKNLRKNRRIKKRKEIGIRSRPLSLF
jgi:hypothetical protein